MKKNLSSQFTTRQYMLPEDFEIFYYTDSKPVNVRSHSHDYYEFYFFMAGDVVMHIDKTSHKMKPGDVMLIPPGVRHHAVAKEDVPYNRIVLWISSAFMKRLMSEADAYGYIVELATEHKEYIFHQDLLSFNEIRGKAFRLLSENQGQEYGKGVQIQICLEDLLLFLNRKAYERRRRDDYETQSVYQSILNYINEHIDEELTLERIAGEFFLSRYYVSHIFKNNSGLSVHQYIIKKRLALCLPSIMANEEITSNLGAFGFGDYTSFYRAFKKEYGMSPREYRELNSVLQVQR